ncbi:hypothetical protein [Marinobacterium sediminicola]|uniref:Uncharacterized protein n=1 Tax=Marinobacterium sediminicola TaxID=518898 RepID=A0ABY1RWQ8_9GAMM|nr:hypothetical protein [Marinobacterium sediminicola]ULG70252.1 hypothetical protein LN244_05415 [Marinobacterium sediminicola]SMR69936.1 hypothetical protein SAMN04487964_101416 [Marinobacterium sediminicola]
MDDQLPSWITLSGFILPALILVLKEHPRDLATVSYLMVIAGLCLLGGLLFSAALIHWQPNIGQPLLGSALVLIGALLSLGLRTLWSRWLKVD